MLQARIPIALLLFVTLTGCDAILGPSDDPATIDVEASRTSFDFVGQTAQLEADVWNEDGDRLTGASVTWATRNPVVAIVNESGVVTGRANGDVWMVGRAGAVADSVLFTVRSPLPCLPTGTLVPADTVTDELVPGECSPRQRYAEAWQINVVESGQITIDLMSEAFNPYLALLDSEGRLIATDNNGGGGLNARIVMNAAAGTYYVVVLPFTEGLSGEYQLSVIPGTHPTPCPPSATIVFPDTVTGTTATGACSYEGFLIDVWRVEIPELSDVIFEVQGDGMGMFMAVTDTFGFYQFGGSEGPADGAWVEQPLLPGAYDIWVGAEAFDAAVDYTLKVLEGPAARSCPTTGSVALNGTATGAITDDDCWAWYAPSDAWTLDIADTTDVTVAVNTAEPIRPALLISDSAGVLVGTGFQRATQYARHDTTLVPGRYRVWVQSYDLEFGDYHLSVAEAGRIGACEPGDAAVLDSTHEGALSTTDCALIDGRYTDGWTLQVDTLTRVTIDLASDKFDAFVIVADSAGEVVGRDDDSGEESNASITLDLEPGDYTLWATSFAAHSIGGYQLTLATAPAGLRVHGDGGWSKAAASPWPPTRTGRDIAPALVGDPPTWLELLRARGGPDGSGR